MDTIRRYCHPAFIITAKDIGQFLLILLFSVQVIGTLSAQQIKASAGDIRVERYKAVIMRDGVKLYADVYLPLAPGKYPTIVTRTTYGARLDNGIEDFVKFAQNGYAVVVQDVRGRYESEGTWNPFWDEAKDGYDTIEWAAAQPFSNGKVGSQGYSYMGHNQWQAMSLNPPHLVAAFPALASTNIYSNWITMGGAFRLSFNYGWGVVRMPNRIGLSQSWHTQRYMPESIKYETILDHLPLSNGDLKTGAYPVRHYREWIQHEGYDDYWRSISDEERFHKVNIPVHTSGGWFDIFVNGTINGYVGVRNKAATAEARKSAKMIIGPWGHGPSQSFGGIDFTPSANVSQFATELRFFDYHLKGLKNGLDTEDPVKLFYMGVNKWRSEKDWPIPGTKYTPLYLQSQGSANTASGNGRLSFTIPAQGNSDKYVYDPISPVPTTGGNNCCGTPTLAGPRDQRELEKRSDILVYTSDVLTSALAIAGPVQMKLFAASDAKDTDWMIKLIDVHPDGKAIPVSEGILRAKFREGLDKIRLLTPNQVYEYHIELTGTANVFKTGHKIRVDITSSNFPQFDRNPNTGDPLGSSAVTRIANQTIHHGSTRLSHVLLPVVSDL